MFFSSVKEISRLSIERNRLLSKEINRLLNEVMSNIYLKVTIEKI